MNIDNFLATMKLAGWRHTDVHNGYRLVDSTDQINIRVLGNITVHQMMYRTIHGSEYSKYETILCECKNFEEALEYVSTLDLTTLLPNGKN